MKNLFFLFLVFSMALGCEKEALESPTVDISKDRILYSKNPNGYNELYKLEDGVETVLISDPNYDYWWPKVSPDKSKLLVYRSVINPDKNHDAYPQAELVLANIDGSNLEVIIPKGSYGWKAQGVCRWNKDGTHILMCAELETNNVVQWRLVRTKADGSNPKILSDRWAIDCNFSPDDKHVVFMGFTENNLSLDLTKLELQRGDYDANAGTITNIISLTDNNTRDHDPDYSPDGKKILFSAGNAIYTNVDLTLFDIASGIETKLLDDSSANGGSMCWSPDGNTIYFHSVKIFSTPFRIKKLDIATGEASTILQTSDNKFGFFHPEAY